jgi:ketosteroid isomerase-like protein
MLAAMLCGRGVAQALAPETREGQTMSTEEEILAIERAAMMRWAKGDPDGFLAIVDTGITYFDPFLDQEIASAKALTDYYNSFRGQVKIDRFEFVEPHVQLLGDVAILTYQFKSWTDGNLAHWNTTEVYRRLPAGWRIVHNHWAFYKPTLAK